MLLKRKNLLVERIVSSSDITPTNYVQPQDEWLVLLQGEATLVVSGSTLQFEAGDHVFLPAGIPHRVEKTSQGAMWLAVHLHAESARQ